MPTCSLSSVAWLDSESAPLTGLDRHNATQHKALAFSFRSSFPASVSNKSQQNKHRNYHTHLSYPIYREGVAVDDGNQDGDGLDVAVDGHVVDLDEVRAGNKDEDVCFGFASSVCPLPARGTKRRTLNAQNKLVRDKFFSLKLVHIYLNNI